MGGCASRPNEFEGDRTEAPPPVPMEEEVAEVAVKNERAVVVAENDTNRQSLGFLFEKDAKLGSFDADKTTNEIVEIKSSDEKKEIKIEPFETIKEDTTIESEKVDKPAEEKPMPPFVDTKVETKSSDEEKEIKIEPSETNQTIKKETTVESAEVDTLKEENKRIAEIKVETPKIESEIKEL